MKLSRLRDMPQHNECQIKIFESCQMLDITLFAKSFLKTLKYFEYIITTISWTPSSNFIFC